MSVLLEHIYKSYGEKQVLSDFSAELSDHAVTCVMGESGCGKTTLLHLLAGLTIPDSGRIHGRPPGKIAMVFQENRLVESFTVWRNLKMVQGVLTKQEAGEMLSDVGMEKSVLAQPVSALSGGMKRRVAILRALLCDSSLVLLDEPTGGLDEANKLAVISYIRKKTQGKTTLWVTHDADEARLASDHLLYLERPS